MSERPHRGLYAVPLPELFTPKNGLVVFADRWWVVCDEGALFYGIPTYGMSPQCNSDRGLPERMAKTYGRGCRAEFLPLAFVPFRVSSEGFDCDVPASAVHIGGVKGDE